MTMEDRVKQILGEQAYIITALQVQLDAAKKECETLKNQLGVMAQGQMFADAIKPPSPPPRTNGEARPDV
jgi:hypothetical protein